MKFISLALCVFATGLALAGCQSISKGKEGPDYKVLAVSYVDSTGLYWLEKLDDVANNGCMDALGNYKTSLCSATIATGADSNAEKQCELFGARLPTMAEYERLLKDFKPDANLGQGLSNETYHQVAMAFKDDMPYAAWTSTVNPENPIQAMFFSWRKGEIHNRVEYRSVELPVRCVRKGK